MTEAVDQVLDLTAWCLYEDTNSDGEEVELFAMRTEDGDTFATNSSTFIRAFREILDIFNPDEVKRLKVMNGVSKNNRTFKPGAAPGFIYKEDCIRLYNDTLCKYMIIMDMLMYLRS